MYEEKSHTGVHWTDEYYVENAYLYLPILEQVRSNGEYEAASIIKLLNKFNLHEKSKILDLSCGIGRHSIPLAIRGYQVIGYDPSNFFLERARYYAEKSLIRNNNIKFYNGRVEEVHRVLSTNNESDFDAVIIMFNSFGFTNEQSDSNLLHDLLKLSKPGAVLIIETENRDWAILNSMLKTQDHYIWELNGILSNEIWTFDPLNSIMHSNSKFYQKSEIDNSYHLKLEIQKQLRLYSLHEIKKKLTETGWIFKTAYSSIKDLDIYSLNSQYFVTVSIRR
jgi:2-polyprenyl-3-methyl-5-hydroxy-6-metoxy-1,4-benzoquinol methylase